ncbi:hypothetical protein BH18VER1_BH18VER1_05530 [soil metagenome]
MGNDKARLAGLGVALALLVLTKENAMFVYIGLLAVLGLTPWLRFGTVSKGLLVTMLVGPLVGVAVLVNLCGSLSTTIQIYRLLVSKASVLPYAIATGDGPWYRYLIDLMIMSPVVLVLALGGIFQLNRTAKAALFLLTFVVASYVLMANVRYGMNLRYATIWDLPLRYFVTLCLVNVADAGSSRANVWLSAMVSVVCAMDLRQYHIFFVEHDLYELVTAGLLRALQILK